jgi:cytoskeletal protein RodZ
MNDDALLKTPGELLSAARERAGFSLAELSTRTKIPMPMLEAIESDEYHRISDPLYVKSFLRVAAVEVGLDPDEILDLHGRATGGGRPASAAEAVWEEQAVTIRRVGLPWGRILAVGGAALILIGAVVFAVRGLVGGGEQAATPVVTERVADAETSAHRTASRESLLTASADGEGAGAAVERPAAQAATATTPPPVAVPAEPDREPDPEPVREPVVQPAATPPVTVAEQPAATPSASDLPSAPAGGPDVPLAAGWPRTQILRIFTTAPVTVSVRRDGERSFTRYRLPGDDGDLAPLPATGIVPGRPYSVRGGIVAYWGARDHFDLVLDRVDGVEVSRNGRTRDLSRVRPGDEIVLDGFSDPPDD